MNDHEAERIAAAMHQLRPDWPAASVLTLIRKHLIDRPRRDVTVALSWVACEAASHTPARVLELGPWWQAAGVEGATTPRPERIHPGDRCAGCDQPEDHRLHTSGDHEFYRRSEVPDFDVSAICADLKARLTEAARPMEQPERPTLDELARSPRAQAVLDEMTAARERLEGAG